MIKKYDRVYKPSYTIEFDRRGEVVLYSHAPNRDKFKILQQYPYNLVEIGSFTLLFAFLANPFGLTWAPRICQLLPIISLMGLRVN